MIPHPFFQLLNDTVDFSEFIPSNFYHAFYQSSIGRKRLYPLEAFLSALIFQKIFSIPSISLLILFLELCQELQDFCGFSKILVPLPFSRFKTTFEPYIEQIFHKMVDFTEPICQLIDSSLEDDLTFDTSRIEFYITENNPQPLNYLNKRLKA